MNHLDEWQSLSTNNGFRVGVALVVSKLAVFEHLSQAAFSQLAQRIHSNLQLLGLDAVRKLHDQSGASDQRFKIIVGNPCLIAVSAYTHQRALINLYVPCKPVQLIGVLKAQVCDQIILQAIEVILSSSLENDNQTSTSGPGVPSS